MDREAVIAEFGARVRKERTDRGWSQEDLAGYADLTPVQISRIERGVREVRLTTILKLATALDVSTALLLDGIASER